ncbi:hypothetical protein, partial [Baaleninema sp.]|uniref:hypothetical protein n=1 Tax=Baaleninema sp. TaxID=3101197 RepID=UPI003CFC7540
PDPETFLNSLKTNPNIYQASLSRQFAANLPPNIQQTTLKDEPKDWYIKTADFGDECDRPLQHRDGEYTQLLEDIQEYHQILQQDCDRIIVLRPPNYGAYNTLLNPAMQCLGYNLSQFQYIVVQPLKLYAFHQLSKQLHTIADLPPSELQKVVNPQTLRWYSLRVPLDEIAPLNLTTASPNHPQNHFHRIQLAYSYTQKHLDLLSKFKPTTNQTEPTTPTEQTLDTLLQQTEQVVQRAIDEVAPYLICQHVEQIAKQTLTWLPTKDWSPNSQQRLTATHNTINDLVESKLGLTLLPQPATAADS